MLTDILPASTRKTVYALYAVVGVVLGAVQVAYSASSSLGQPEWLNIALAVFGFVGTAIGAVAASNTKPSQP